MRSQPHRSLLHPGSALRVLNATLARSLERAVHGPDRDARRAHHGSHSAIPAARLLSRPVNTAVRYSPVAMHGVFPQLAQFDEGSHRPLAREAEWHLL